MALNGVQQNTVSNLHNLAAEMLKLKPRIDTLVQQYYNELYPDMVAEAPLLTDKEIQAVPDFAHLRAGDVVNVVAALQGLQQWGGDLTSGHWGVK